MSARGPSNLRGPPLLPHLIMMTPHSHPRTRGPPLPTNACETSIRSPQKEGREPELFFEGPPGSQRGVRTQLRQRLRLAESRAALRGTARGRSGPANLTRWPAVPRRLLRLRVSTARPRPRLAHLRPGDSVLRTPSGPYPTTSTRTGSEPLPLPPPPRPPRLGHLGGMVATTASAGVLRPGPPALPASERLQPLGSRQDAGRLHCFRSRPEKGPGWVEGVGPGGVEVEEPGV